MLDVKCLMLKYITEQLFRRQCWINANSESRPTSFLAFYHIIKLGLKVQNTFNKFLMAYAGLII